MIESEQLLEKECTQANINVLISIYSEAIEFYESLNDSKAKTYQEKLQSLFLKPEVIAAMNINSSRAAKKEEKKVEVQPKIRGSSQILSNDDKETQQSKSMSRIINSQIKRNSEVFKKAQIEFKTQDSDLSNRLASRKKSMLSKSTILMKENSFSSKVPVDNILKEINEAENQDQFYEELDKIMNQLCDAKAKKLAEIKIQYEVQMEPLKNQGILMKKVLDKMKEDMDAEISDVTEKYAQMYQDELQKLKNKYKP
jgi:hypothetical protein